VVRVLELGAEPRTRLRYRLAGPRSEETSMRMTSTIATGMGGSAGTELTMPAMRILMTVDSAPAGKGELTANFRITQADVEETPGTMPGVIERMRAELPKLLGITIESRMTTRGATRQTRSSLPPDAPASLRGTIESLDGGMGRNAVLPLEAVGVGARWEADEDIQQSGMKVHQRTRYRLDELAGTRLGLAVEVELSAGAQSFPLPGGGGLAGQLESMQGSGSGSTTLELGSVVPRLAHADVDTHLTMRIPVSGQSVTASMRMKAIIDMHAGR
jgi:hypothetical protein